MFINGLDVFCTKSSDNGVDCQQEEYQSRCSSFESHQSLSVSADQLAFEKLSVPDRFLGLSVMGVPTVAGGSAYRLRGRRAEPGPSYEQSTKSRHSTYHLHMLHL